MTVPTLEAIIFSETIRREWRCMIAAHGIGLIRSKGWTKNRKIEIDRAIKEVTGSFLGDMVKHHLPTYLQHRWAVTFNGVVREAYNFLLDLTNNVDPELPVEEMMLFPRMVLFSQNCTVDTPKTILALLERSEMEIFFDHNFMLNHLVMQEDLLSLLAKLHAQLNEREKYRAPKIVSKKRKQLQNAHREIVQYCDIKALAASANNNNTTKDNLHFIRYLNESTHSKLFEFWMELLCPSEQVLIEIANEVFEYFDDEYRNVPPELAMLLLEYLSKEILLEGTQAPPKLVFNALAGSWRSRHYCADWFLLLLPRLDASESAALLTKLCSYLDDDRLQVGQILSHIWNNVPEKHKNDEVMRKTVSCLLTKHNFQKAIVALMKDYDVEKANEILIWSLQESLKQSKPNMQALRTLVWEMKNLYVKQSDVYLNESQLKTLLNVRKYSIFTPFVLDVLLALTSGDRHSIKSSLTTDLKFIMGVLNKNWGGKITWTFLHWLLEYDGQAVQRYLCRVERSVIKPLFAKKVHSCIPINAAAGLSALRRDPVAAFAAALGDPQVEARLTNRLIEAAAFTSFKPGNWEILWSCRGSLKNLLLSAGGKQAILSIVTKPCSNPPSANFTHSHLSRILIEYKNICNNLLRPHGLCAEVDAYLAESGHPNADGAGGAGAGASFSAERRQLVDFRYRALRALLTRDLALPARASEGRRPGDRHGGQRCSG